MTGVIVKYTIFYLVESEFIQTFKCHFQKKKSVEMFLEVLLVQKESFVLSNDKVYVNTLYMAAVLF